MHCLAKICKDLSEKDVVWMGADVLDLTYTFLWWWCLRCASCLCQRDSNTQPYHQRGQILYCTLITGQVVPLLFPFWEFQLHKNKQKIYIFISSPLTDMLPTDLTGCEMLFLQFLIFILYFCRLFFFFAPAQPFWDVLLSSIFYVKRADCCFVCFFSAWCQTWLKTTAHWLKR